MLLHITLLLLYIKYKSIHYIYTYILYMKSIIYIIHTLGLVRIYGFFALECYFLKILNKIWKKKLIKRINKNEKYHLTFLLIRFIPNFLYLFYFHLSIFPFFLIIKLLFIIIIFERFGNFYVCKFWIFVIFKNVTSVFSKICLHILKIICQFTNLKNN